MEILNEEKVVEKSNLPEKKFYVGGISATVWKNESLNSNGDKVSFRTVGFEKSYKDKEGNWKTTNILRVSDLPKAALVLNKAYEFINLNQN